ncbi:MAG: hypothetical protein PVJ32_01850 [Anaerolineales bacterium]|jgi:hypothetical protein
MPQAVTRRKPVVDVLMVVAIAAIAMSLNVAVHEGVHALTCLAVGGQLREYSALYASCESSTVWQMKAVAASAPIFNLLAGTLFWLIVRNARKASPEARYFFWLFMLMNWFYGAGYFIFSGVTNIGDYAVVIRGWEPNGLWRALMTIFGSLIFVLFVWLALQEFGKMIGGDPDEQIGRANKLFLLSYVTAVLVVLAAGIFCPEGIMGLPVTAGVTAALGALSPLLWMTRWLPSKSIPKPVREPLEIRRKWSWVIAAIFVVSIYAVILGRTLYF